MPSSQSPGRGRGEEGREIPVTSNSGIYTDGGRGYLNPGTQMKARLTATAKPIPCVRDVDRLTSATQRSGIFS